jgi:hypothetical protein
MSCIPSLLRFQDCTFWRIQYTSLSGIGYLNAGSINAASHFSYWVAPISHDSILGDATERQQGGTTTWIRSAAVERRQEGKCAVLPRALR